jgi:hypothetical protein
VSESKGFVGFVPSTFANRFYVSVTPTITRITFCDLTPDGNETPHTGMVMATTDALALANLIKQLSDDNRKQHPELYRTVGDP